MRAQRTKSFVYLSCAKHVKRLNSANSLLKEDDTAVMSLKSGNTVHDRARVILKVY